VRLILRLCTLEPPPSTYTDNMLDGAVLALKEREILSKLRHKTIRLIIEDERVKLHKVGFMRVIQQ